MTLLTIPVLVLVAAASALLTGMMRRYALGRDMLDVPNHRSSHTTPTPRGGGLSIVLLALLGTVLAGTFGLLPPAATVALAGGGCVVAAIGFVDDRWNLPARWRLLAHLAAAAWLIAWLGELPPLRLAGAEVPWNGVTMALAALFVVWLTNLYNFMDGIDALAAVQAVTVAAPTAFLLHLGGATGLALVPAVYAAAALGFLAWNLPPAKVFMGDAGSGFLGFSFAALALATHAQGVLTLWAWLILLGVFIVDATVTLVRRMVTGQPWYKAHRDHAYQHAARAHQGHGAVAGTTAAINLCWLAPLAAWSAAAPEWGIALLLLAWLPLLVLAVRYKAGVPA